MYHYVRSLIYFCITILVSKISIAEIMSGNAENQPWACHTGENGR